MNIELKKNCNLTVVNTFDVMVFQRQKHLQMQKPTGPHLNMFSKNYTTKYKQNNKTNSETYEQRGKLPKRHGFHEDNDGRRGVGSAHLVWYHIFFSILLRVFSIVLLEVWIFLVYHSSW